MAITEEGFEFEPREEHYPRAVRAIIRERCISPGAIHRELRCGYKHAVILFEQMKAEGIIKKGSNGLLMVVRAKTEFAFKVE